MIIEEKDKMVEIERLKKNAVEKPMKEEIMAPPTLLTPKTVIYWSNHYKKLEGCPEGKAIQTKARKFVEQDLVKYDKEKKEYYVEPIVGYNKTTYNLKWNKELKDFECNCQYFQTKMKKGEKPICSHNLAVWLSIKITNWNRKELNSYFNSE